MKIDREIKFRGMSIYNDKWVYGYYFFVPCEKAHYIQSLNTNSKEQVYPSTVSQYTGLVDGNGAEIYEGDILREHGQEFVDWLVIYDDGAFKGYYRGQLEPLSELTDYEVVGTFSDYMMGVS